MSLTVKPQQKRNELDRVVVLTMSPREAAVLSSLIVDNPVLREVRGRIILQLDLMRRPADPEQRAPYPV